MISYRHWLEVWSDFPARARELASATGVRRVCELGGGANPMLDLEFIAAHGLEYDVVDISEEELGKAPPGYRTVQADATSPAFAREHGPYDVIVSAFLAEHVADPRGFHASVHDALAPGGFALHTFPTLYEPAFVLNRLIPERVAEPLLLRVQSDRVAEGSHGKFDAYYRWCRGPTQRQVDRFEALGFEVVEYVGYFGHDYLAPVPPLNRLEQRLAHALVRRPVAALTSYATVLLRRSR
jgi:2-polyprenyl-3-methyl-5-hydroxy-6-metoxy-1,4-benzoquinol methylase